jgi:DNA-binding GntR family transcriptional regulator
MSRPVPAGKLSGSVSGDLTNNVYLQLREDILAGQFAPDAVLLETALAQRYGISRTPVREALVLLEHDGFLSRASRGFHIRKGTAQDVMEIYDVRIALETAATRAAAARRTELDVIRLNQLTERAAQLPGTDELLVFNSRWHETVWQTSRNTLAAATLSHLTERLRVCDQAKSEKAEGADPTNGEHQAITKAIADRDGQLADELMGKHLIRIRDLRLKAIMDS